MLTPRARGLREACQQKPSLFAHKSAHFMATVSPQAPPSAEALTPEHPRPVRQMTRQPTDSVPTSNRLPASPASPPPTQRFLLMVTSSVAPRQCLRRHSAGTSHLSPRRSERSDASPEGRRGRRDRRDRRALEASYQRAMHLRARGHWGLAAPIEQAHFLRPEQLLAVCSKT